MADKEEKLDKALEAVYEMRPVLLDVRENQKAMDIRVRATEARGEQHEVKIRRVQEDLDGLGRRVREKAVALPARSEGNWRGVVDFLSVVPAYWHVVVSAMMFLATVLITAWRHK